MSEIIYGIHTVLSLLEHTPERCKELFISKNNKNKRIISIIQKLENKNILIKKVNKKYLNKKSRNAVHQGIIAKVQFYHKYEENYLSDIVLKFDNIFLLILDGITDPHNLGACLRSADAAGINAIIIPKNNSAKLNSTVKKVACGAAERIPLIQVTNLARTIRILKKNNIWIIGTVNKTNSIIYESKMTGRIAIVVGSEGLGIRRIIREYCDELIKIPMFGSVQSLNVSVATGVCLFEAIRQRNFSKL